METYLAGVRKWSLLGRKQFSGTLFGKVLEDPTMVTCTDGRTTLRTDINMQLGNQRSKEISQGPRNFLKLQSTVM